jgi:hypothetical protein
MTFKMVKKMDDWILEEDFEEWTPLEIPEGH